MKHNPAILALIFAAQFVRADETKITKDGLDGEFGRRIVVLYQSKDFSEGDSRQVFRKVSEIARDVYGPHAAVMKEAAKQSFEALPKLAEDQVERVKAPIVFPVAEVIDVMKSFAGTLEKEPTTFKEAARAILDSKEGGLAFLNNSDAGSACWMAMHLAIEQQPANAEFLRKRAILNGYTRDKVRRLNDDYLHPRIAVQSLGDWFVVTLDWADEGFYFPNRIEWHKKGEPDGAANGSQPFSSDTNRTSGTAGSRR